jgi:hypothetical protein
MEGAFQHTIADSTDGCNNTFRRSLNLAFADYTISLPKIEGERPRTFDSVKLIAVDDLFRLLLRHCLWFAYDLHCLRPIHIRAFERNGEAAFAQHLLDRSASGGTLKNEIVSQRCPA